MNNFPEITINKAAHIMSKIKPKFKQNRMMEYSRPITLYFGADSLELQGWVSEIKSSLLATERNVSG